MDSADGATITIEDDEGNRSVFLILDGDFEDTCRNYFNDRDATEMKIRLPASVASELYDSLGKAVGY